MFRNYSRGRDSEVKISRWFPWAEIKKPIWLNPTKSYTLCGVRQNNFILEIREQYICLIQTGGKLALVVSDFPICSGIKVFIFDELVKEGFGSLLLFITALFLQPYIRVPQQLPMICFETQGEIALPKLKDSASLQALSCVLAGLHLTLQKGAEFPEVLRPVSQLHADILDTLRHLRCPWVPMFRQQNPTHSL